MHHLISARRVATRRGWRRALGLPIAAAAGSALLVTLATPAWAHVEAAGKTEAGGITTVTFTFAHGCAASPTTGLKVQLPDGTTAVTPQNPAGWTSTATATELTWSGGSIPDSTPGEFVASMRIVGTKGDTVFLPTVQLCQTGQEDWIEKTAEAEAEHAAPRIVLDETVTADPAITTTTIASTITTARASTTTATVSDTTTPDTKNNVGVVVLIVVMALIAGGALVLYLRNRRPRTP
jgi:uncharacterized protein YcnI